MNKEELLVELSSKISKGEITYNEIMSRFDLTAVKTEIPVKEIKSNQSLFSITKFLYVLGAIIVIVGIILFTNQIWDDIGSSGRILITLGMGLLITGIGSLLLKNKAQETVGMIFHFIGGMLIPGGAFVMLSEFSPNQIESWPLAITFGIIFAFYISINLIHKSVILTFFSIANGTAFIYLLVDAITNGVLNSNTNLYAYLTIIVGMSYILLTNSFKNTWNERLVPALYLFGFAGIQIALFARYFNSFGYQDSIWPVTFSIFAVFLFYLFINLNIKNPALTLLIIANGTALVYTFVQGLIGVDNYSNADIYTYITIVMGIVYLLLSHSFRNTWNSRLLEILNFIGIIGFLGASFSEIYGSPLWQFLFIIFVIGGFALSIYVKSLSVLVISTLFLLAYVSYITSEYFADSIGWPISLVSLGFIFIGLGYMSISINKKYIKQ